jgi:predicted DNA binding CopG/RHH family protein
MSTDEQMKNEILAGCQMNIALLDLVRPNIGVYSKEQIGKMTNDMLKNIMPSKFKDLSAQDLRDQAVQDFLEEVSITCMKNKKDGYITFKIPTTLCSSKAKLIEHWTAKGFEIETDEFNTTLRW